MTDRAAVDPAPDERVAGEDPTATATAKTVEAAKTAADTEAVGDEPTQAGPARRRTLKERFSEHAAEYGKVAVYTYLALSLSTIAAFSIAFGIGAAPSSATGVLGVIGAGWVAAKATLPLRLLASLGLTPLIAGLIHRLKRRR